MCLKRSNNYRKEIQQLKLKLLSSPALQNNNRNNQHLQKRYYKFSILYKPCIIWPSEQSYAVYTLLLFPLYAWKMKLRKITSTRYWGLNLGLSQWATSSALFKFLILRHGIAKSLSFQAGLEFSILLPQSPTVLV